MEKKSISTVISLNNGVKMPTLAFGTYKIPLEVLPNVLTKALETGYRHIDTARMYKNEHVIGDTLSNLFKEKKYKREDLFITTKVWNDIDSTVEIDLKNALKDLRLEYLDLVLIHWPFGEMKNGKLLKKPNHEIWKELEVCYEKGMCRAIGVSNYNYQSMSDLLSYCKFKPTMNQIENHVFLAQNELVKYCKENQVEITAYCPLTRRGYLNKYPEIDICNNAILAKIADKNKKTIPQICINWLLMRGIAVAVKSNNLERVVENFESCKFELSEEDFECICKLDKGFRVVTPHINEMFYFQPIFN